MTPEKRIVNAIMGWLLFQRDCFAWINDSVGIYDAAKGIFRRNTSRYKIKGVSDILGIWKGKFLAIEVKTKTGRISPEQAAFLQRVINHGGIAFVARSVEDVERHLKFNTLTNDKNSQTINSTRNENKP